MFKLGIMYENGLNGLKVDKNESYKWFKKAADAGSVKGTASVGVYLLWGWGGVEKDQTEGLVLLVSAAKDGSNYACYNLGRMYFDGRYGSKVNYTSAKHWFEKAVARGEGSCQHKHLSPKLADKARGRIAECNAHL